MFGQVLHAHNTYETVYPIAIAFEGKNALVQFIKSL